MCRINIKNLQREVEGILHYFENSKHLNNTLKFEKIKKVLNYNFFKLSSMKGSQYLSDPYKVEHFLKNHLFKIICFAWKRSFFNIEILRMIVLNLKPCWLRVGEKS